MESVQISLVPGDCRRRLKEIPSGTVDAVICDPPYPEISRAYGTLSEDEWHDLMRAVIVQCRRILKPSGSAVFILQPNSAEAGRMRLWFWEFVVWAGKAWNLIQDVWWWNITTPPQGYSISDGLLRPSLKACVWLGPPDAYRNQTAVLWEESHANAQHRLAGRCVRNFMPSGISMDQRGVYRAAVKRGGVTPFNVLPIGNTNNRGNDTKVGGHPARTPAELANWWVRYISPPGGLIVDPFCGYGTIPIEAVKLGRSAVGIEQVPAYFEQARRKAAEALAPAGG